MMCIFPFTDASLDVYIYFVRCGVFFCEMLMVYIEARYHIEIEGGMEFFCLVSVIGTFVQFLWGVRNSIMVHNGIYVP